MTALYNVMPPQRRREAIAKVPEKLKLLVAESAVLLAESETYAYPWCERRVPFAYMELLCEIHNAEKVA